MQRCEILTVHCLLCSPSWLSRTDSLHLREDRRGVTTSVDGHVPGRLPGVRLTVVGEDGVDELAVVEQLPVVAACVKM